VALDRTDSTGAGGKHFSFGRAKYSGGIIPNAGLENELEWWNGL